jgi:adrenodoxin-NADP+ reductase
MIQMSSLSSSSSSSSSSINDPHHHIAIVGSGPAGFYTTKYLLDKNPNIHIDIIEKLPTPYGLVRFGVAPDHQEVKSVMSQFYEIADDPRVRFFGNVSIALKVNNNNVSTNNVIELEELRKKYSAVVLSYGASSDIPLGIENENLDGIISARSFVNWYNGHPDNVNIGNEINLNKVGYITF